MKSMKLRALLTLPALALSAWAFPGTSAAAATNPAAVERPSIMQSEDRAHQGLTLNLPSDIRPDGSLPKADPRRPARAAANTPGARAYNGAGLTREVFGFATYWELANGDFSDLQYDKVSTISYFGLTYTSQGTFDNSDGGASGWNSQALTSLVNTAHANGDKVVVTVKAFDDGTIGSIVNNGTNGQTAISQAIAAMTSRGLDGINVDFEGSGGNLQQPYTNWIANLSSQMHSQQPGSFLTVDTYSGAASWSGGFMRIDTLAPYVDAFFIMAYDMAIGNAQAASVPPTLPNAPLAGNYAYTDTQSVDQYVSKAGDPNKVILGVPYYGYKSSTLSAGFNAPTNPNDHLSCAITCADTYANIRSEFQCAQSLSTFWDGPSSTPWAVWNSPGNDPCTAPNPGHNSIRELYYDDGTSLSAKYDMVNNRNIRGVGMWALGYDHGYPDLWNAIGTKLLVVPPSWHVNALQGAQGSSAFQVCWSANANSGAANQFQVWAQDGSSGGWLTWVITTSTCRTFYGFAGHNYNFYVQAYGPGGNMPGPGAAQASTTINALAAKANAYTSMYTMEAYGGVHGVQSPPVPLSAYWPGWQIAQSMASNSSGTGGYTLDGWGGLHPFGPGTPAEGAGPYWQGWDIARDVALLPGGSGGYVLDGWGGVHPFAAAGQALPPAANISGYWSGWDIARKLVLFPDGTGGYVLDGWGGIHAFSTGANPMPAQPTSTAYWNGWNIARGITLVPGTHSGYVLDGWGGVHPFAAPATQMPAAVSNNSYWYQWDIARAVVISPAATPGSPSGWTIDGWGGAHPFGSAPAVTTDGYWPGQDIVRSAGIS
jgi:spore germination protein YaaH